MINTTANKTITSGNWTAEYSNKELLLPEIIAKEGKKILKEWTGFFPKEDTWAKNNLEVPSLLVRFDHYIDEKGHMKICEIEEEPAGTGFATVINPQFKKKLESLKKEWPSFKLVIAPNWSGNDDALWMEEIKLEDWKPPQLVWVKSLPCDTQYHCLENFSVTSLKRKWDKSYGEKMGLWKIVSFADINSFPWDKGFVLKPLVGCRSKNIEIWDPKKQTGYSTRTRIGKTLKSENKMYLQEFITPNTNEQIDGNILFRTSYGFNPSAKKWECLGGVWIARKNLRIHGSEDSLWGPLLLKQ